MKATPTTHEKTGQPPVQTKYRVITSDNEVDLVIEINDALAEGWLLVGGVSVSFQIDFERGYRHVESVFAQALARDTPVIAEQ